jgi:hypothetical protein
MSKIAITKDDLSDKVLAAIQAHQGCEAVKEIAITQVEIIDGGTTWHANVIDSGEADWQLAATVLRQVRGDSRTSFRAVRVACQWGYDGQSTPEKP